MLSSVSSLLHIISGDCAKCQINFKERKFGENNGKIILSLIHLSVSVRLSVCLLWRPIYQSISCIYSSLQPSLHRPIVYLIIHFLSEYQYIQSSVYLSICFIIFQRLCTVEFYRDIIYPEQEVRNNVYGISNTIGLHANGKSNH